MIRARVGSRMSVRQACMDLDALVGGILRGAARGKRESRNLQCFGKLPRGIKGVTGWYNSAQLRPSTNPFLLGDLFPAHQCPTPDNLIRLTIPHPPRRPPPNLILACPISLSGRRRMQMLRLLSEPGVQIILLR